jgi:3-isopropylmalate/(R)-2-methylmalate dehydratase small subunit
VTADVLGELIKLADSESAELIVDLESQTLTGQGVSAFFEIDADARRRLLAGLDPIGETLQLADAIGVHESTRPKWMPIVSL